MAMTKGVSVSFRALVVMAVLGIALCSASTAEAAGSLSSYTGGLAGTSPSSITEGPEGNLWFTAGAGNLEDSMPMIGRSTTSGAITTFDAGLGTGSSPHDITAGPDGNLWFTDSPVYGRGTAAIGRITPSGTITEFTNAKDEEGNPIELSEPRDILAGPDGNLWFVSWAYVGGEPAIGKITPSGVITEYRLPQLVLPTSLVIGPDGYLWFTNATRLQGGTGSIDRITTGGTITTFSAGIQSGGKPSDIVVGPDNNLWFTVNSNESNGPAGIGRITPSGAITEYTSGLQSESHPEEIVSGADGSLWFTDHGGSGQVEGEHPTAGQIGRITTSGTISEYGHYLSPNEIIAGPDGNIWVTDGDHGLDRVTPSGQTTFFWLGLLEDEGLSGLVSGPGGSGIWLAGSGYDEEEEQTGAIQRVDGVGSGAVSPSPTIEVEPLRPGSGTVISSPAGISCPGACSAAFAPGTQVTLTVTAASGWYSITPSLAMKGEDPCPVVLPPVTLPSATCHFTVNGDAYYRANLEELGEEEQEVPNGGGGGGDNLGGGGGSENPTGGGGGTPTGGSGGAAPSSGASSTTPGSGPLPSPTRRATPKPKPLKCHRGFKKQKVHGKSKCVKSKKSTKVRAHRGSKK
jgi:streptogramin lyase